MFWFACTYMFPNSTKKWKHQSSHGTIWLGRTVHRSMWPVVARSDCCDENAPILSIHRLIYMRNVTAAGGMRCVRTMSHHFKYTDRKQKNYPVNQWAHRWKSRHERRKHQQIAKARPACRYPNKRVRSMLWRSNKRIVCSTVVVPKRPHP